MKQLLAIVCLMMALHLPVVSQTLYSHGDPTPEEQLMLEMINRARANPTEEGIRLMDTPDAAVQMAYNYFGINKAATKAAFTTYPARAPLAFHPDLIRASRAHTADMDANNFQGHNSSNGDDMTKRYQKVGYTSQGMYGENVAAYSESIWHGHCGLNVDWGEENQQQLGHRENIMNFKSYQYTEIGIGILFNGKGLMQGHVGPYVITQNFGMRSVRYIVGVVYNDRNANGFYDIGEGLEGVEVKPSRGSNYAVTSASGGYAIPFSGNGSVTITASGGGLANAMTKTVDFSGDNVKVDFAPAPQRPGQPTLSAPANNATNVARTIDIRWSAAAMAASYEYQVSTTQNFSAGTIVSSGSSSALTASVTTTACATRHYWRVRGVNDVGEGSWSAVFSFTTGGKLPASTSSISPKGNVLADQAGTVPFSWSAAADATTYDIRIKMATAPFTVVFEDSLIATNKTDIPASILASGAYTWEVRSANDCGKGGWSTPATISVTVTGVAEFSSRGWSFSALPFPVSDKTRFELVSPVDGNVRILATDVTGASSTLGVFSVSHGNTMLPIAHKLTTGFSVLSIEYNGLVVARLKVLVE